VLKVSVVDVPRRGRERRRGPYRRLCARVRRRPDASHTVDRDAEGGGRARDLPPPAAVVAERLRDAPGGRVRSGVGRDRGVSLRTAERDAQVRTGARDAEWDPAAAERLQAVQMDRSGPCEGGRSDRPRSEDKEGRHDEQEPSHRGRASHSAAAAATASTSRSTERLRRVLRLQLQGGHPNTATGYRAP
jgi:hypothetical protein